MFGWKVCELIGTTPGFSPSDCPRDTAWIADLLLQTALPANRDSTLPKTTLIPAVRAFVTMFR
jgi:hypothetical protein